MMSWLEGIIRHPRWILALLLLTTLGFLYPMTQNSRMETDLDEYMPGDHPAFVYSDQAEERFQIQDGILLAVENPTGIYQPGTLEKIRRLTEALQSLEEIADEDVTSLYTAENIIGSEGGLEVEPFYQEVPTTEGQLKALQTKVRNNEMVFERLVSSDETVTLIVAEMQDDLFSQEFYHRIQALADGFEGPERIHVAGRPIVEGTMAYLGPKDMKRMVPIVVLVILLVLRLVLGSFKASLITLSIVLFSTIWTFGLMALLGIPIYAVSTMIPVMLIAIGVADGIHLYSHLQLYIQSNPSCSSREAVLDMLREMWRPVLITSVTTAVGFISLVSSEVYPIKYFGLFTAFGVMMAMVFSLVLLPAALLVFGLPQGGRSKDGEGSDAPSWSHGIAQGLVRHSWISYLVASVLVAVSLFGVSKIWINSSFLEKFETDSEIVLTDRFINEHFGGTSTLNVILNAQEAGRLLEPELLRLLDQLQETTQQQAMVGGAFSLVDYVKRMHKVMHADQAAYYAIPDNRELIAQYLLLYEISGDPDKLWQVVDNQFRQANLAFQLKSDNSKTINQALKEIERLQPAFEKLGVELRYAGSGYKSLVFTDLILEGQIISLFISLLLIILLLSLMFKRISLGLIGAIPITLTAVISFGVMGLLNIPLSTTTALISSIAVGIGIDYAVHFIERYQRYLSQTGDWEQTIGLTMHHSGRAILFNALVVSLGFLVLLFSVFPPNRALGGLVALNMLTSFLGTVTVMFLVLHHMERKKLG